MGFRDKLTVGGVGGFEGGGGGGDEEKVVVVLLGLDNPSIFGYVCTNWRMTNAKVSRARCQLHQQLGRKNET